ncbi:Galactose-specific lectin nattectin [Anabarilius grahami]|uniref:Galactose-specific lectin nattectin n=1 Tax=Anabarilius grahami TaxID=495550 RepID=A0A3N0YUF8_ANAGA|nr:Galactose-specific lectin nattectin [Anabarilius grahami]
MSPSLSQQVYKVDMQRHRRRKKQVGESNEPDYEQSGRDKFKTTVFIAIIDHIIAELDRRYHSYKDIQQTFGFLSKIPSIPLQDLRTGADHLQKKYAACRKGWSAFGCRCFKSFYNPQTWSRAEKYCLGNKGNLASVHSHEEYVFIQRMIRHETHASTRAWIGGYDAAGEGVWLWSDGSQIDYEIWSPGEPNNNAGKEHCLEMNYKNGNWNDDKCYITKPFVCVY